MSSKAIVWIREDFRINLNPALSHACQNHNEVVALYIFNPKNFINKREAQLWWISKSLESYSRELSNFNINLEIQKGDEIEVLSCLLYTSPSPRDQRGSRMPSSA